MFREPFVSILAALFDPLTEGLSDAGIDNVADVRSRHFPDLTQDRQRVHNILVAQPEVHDVVKRHPLILRDCDDFDIIAMDCLY